MLLSTETSCPSEKKAGTFPGFYLYFKTETRNCVTLVGPSDAYLSMSVWSQSMWVMMKVINKTGIDVGAACTSLRMFSPTCMFLLCIRLEGGKGEISWFI